MDLRDRIEAALKYDERIWRAYLLLKPIHKDGLLEALAAAVIPPTRHDADGEK